MGNRNKTPSKRQGSDFLVSLKWRCWRDRCQELQFLTVLILEGQRDEKLGGNVTRNGQNLSRHWNTEASTRSTAQVRMQRDFNVEIIFYGSSLRMGITVST